MTSMDPAESHEDRMQDWVLSTLPDVEMVTESGLSVILRNFEQCQVVWAYSIAYGPLEYDALATATAAELDVSERWAREIISRLRESSFLLSVDFGSKMYLKASCAFALLIDVYSDFGERLAVLAQQTTGFGMAELVRLAEFEHLKMPGFESRFYDTSFFGVSGSTYHRTMKDLYDLKLIEKPSSRMPLRCTQEGKSLAARLCAVCYVAMAEVMM